MKKIYSMSILLLAASLATMSLTSCEADGFDERTVGNLDGDLTSDLPAGYRVRTVGDISYAYKSNGKLDYIRMNDEKFDMSGNTLEVKRDEGTAEFTFKFNALNNLVKINYKLKSANADNSAGAVVKFNYISRQLTGIEVESEEQFVEDGQKITYAYDADYEFTYDNQSLRRLKVKTTETENNGGEKKTAKQTHTYSFKYDNTPDFYNRFYQWTPHVADACLGEQEDIISAMAYIGMLGRATRQLPYAIICKTEGKDLSGRTIDDDFKFECEYEFNSYDAIRLADDVKYTYTEHRDDYEVKANSFDFDADTRAAVAERSLLNIGLLNHMRHHNRK